MPLCRWSSLTLPVRVAPVMKKSTHISLNLQRSCSFIRSDRSSIRFYLTLVRMVSANFQSGDANACTSQATRSFQGVSDAVKVENWLSDAVVEESPIGILSTIPHRFSDGYNRAVILQMSSRYIPIRTFPLILLLFLSSLSVLNISPKRYFHLGRRFRHHTLMMLRYL